jgi:hypothetical protein
MRNKTGFPFIVAGTHGQPSPNCDPPGVLADRQPPKDLHGVWIDESDEAVASSRFSSVDDPQGTLAAVSRT